MGLGDLPEYIDGRNWWVGVKAWALLLIIISIPTIILGMIPLVGLVIAFLYWVTIGFMAIPWATDVARGN